METTIEKMDRRNREAENLAFNAWCRAHIALRIAKAAMQTRKLENQMGAMIIAAAPTDK